MVKCCANIAIKNLFCFVLFLSVCLFVFLAKDVSTYTILPLSAMNTLMRLYPLLP